MIGVASWRPALGGFRRETMDRSQSDFFRNRDFERQMQDSEKSIRAMFLRKGSFDAEATRQLYQSAERARKKALQDWRAYVDGSVLLGETKPYAKVVQDVGSESNIVKMMYQRRYSPYTFREQDLRQMLKLPQGEERLGLYRELSRGLKTRTDVSWKAGIPAQ